MSGSVEVPEYSRADIPIAAVVEWQGEVEYRYHNGRFYRRGSHSSAIGDPKANDESRRSKVEFEWATAMFTGMGFAAARRWYEHETMRKSPLWPTDAVYFIDRRRHWNMSGTITTTPEWRGEWKEPTLALADLRSPNVEDIEFSETGANALAADVICIEGWLWHTTSEPLLFLVPSHAYPFSIETRRFFEDASSNAIFQPAPFGATQHSVAVESPSYWRWDGKAYSLADHQSVVDIMGEMARQGTLAGGETPPVVDVRMPEVFGENLPELEMVRVARGICADIVGSQKEGVGKVYPTHQKWKPETSRELRRLCTDVHRLAVGVPTEENLLALSSVLESLSQALPNYNFASRSTAYQKRGEIAEMPNRIAEILDDYDRSTINLSLPPGFRP
jgi:hypothetical protein